MFLRRKNKSKGAANTTVLGPQTTYTLPTVEPVVIQPIVTENIVVAENPPLGNVPIQQSSDFVGFVQRIEESIARLQKERITEDELDDKGKRVLEELRQFLLALHTFLQTKKVDTLCKSAFTHASQLAGDIRQDRELGMHLIDWRSTYFSFDPESNNALSNIYLFMVSLKETKAIFGLLAGALRLIEQALAGDPSNESLQDAFFDEFVALMRALNHNTQWRDLIARSRAATEDSRTRILPENRPRIKLTERPGYAEVERDLRQLMEELMGEQDSQHVNSFFSHIKAFFQEIRNTPMYREFIVDAEELLADVAANPDTLEDPEARVALKGMYRSAIRILKEVGHNPHLQAAKQDIIYVGRAINNDPLTRNLVHDFGVVAKDILASDTKHMFDYKLIAQFRRILVPMLIETFREIRIPPIKGVTTNKKMKYHIHGIVLSSIELLPENVKIESTYKINSDPLHLSLHEHDTILWVEVERIRAHVKGTAWSYEKLNFPQLKDEGLASVSLGGYGARVGLKLRISREGGGNILQVLDSYCVIDRLDVALYECNHKIIYKFLHHYIVKRLKNAVELSVADKLGQCVAIVDQRLMSVVTKSKKQRDVVRRRVAQVKSLMKKPQSSQGVNKKSLKTRMSSPTTQRRALHLVSKARKSAEARAPPYYNSRSVPHPGHSTTTTTTTVETAVPTMPNEPTVQTTTTTTSTTTSMSPEKTATSAIKSTATSFSPSGVPVIGTAPLLAPVNDTIKAPTAPIVAPLPATTISTAPLKVTPSTQPLSDAATTQAAPSTSPLSSATTPTTTFAPSTAPLSASTSTTTTTTDKPTLTKATTTDTTTTKPITPSAAPLASTKVHLSSAPLSTTTTTTLEKPAATEVDSQGSYMVTL